jgi:hypothetical protein
MKKYINLFLGVLCLLGASVAVAEKDVEKGVTQTTNVILRTYERTITLAPGEEGNIASVCLTGEAVVGGGPTGIPGQVNIVYSSLIYDGVNSGWAVEWKNNGTETVTVTPETGALCVKGTITLG